MLFDDGLPYRFTLRDLSFGEHTDITVEAGIDLFSAAELRRTRITVANQHGIVSPGQDWQGSKTLTFPLTIFGYSWSNIEEMLLAVKAAFAPASDGPLEMTLQTRAREYVVYGKPGRVSTDLSGLPDYANAVCEFELTDPLFYSSTLEQFSIPLGVTGPGFGSPFDSPFGGGSSTPGTVAASNDGTAPTGITFALFSQGMSAPVVSIVGGGQVSLPGLTVPVGQWLVIDTAAQEAVLRMSPTDPSGESTVAQYIDWDDSEFFLLPPGASTLEWRGLGVGSGLVSWRSAWWS